MLKMSKTALTLTFALFILLWMPHYSHTSDKAIVRIGFYVSPPFFFTEKNKVAGFYADIIDYIADKNGLSPVYIHGTFKDHIDNLSEGVIDILPGIPDTVNGDFVTGHISIFEDWYTLVVPRGIKHGDISDIPEYRLGVLDNWQTILAEKDISFLLSGSGSVVKFNSIEQIDRNILSGTIDAAYIRHSTALAFLKRNKNLKILPLFFSPFFVKTGYSKGSGYKELFEEELASIRNEKHFYKKTFSDKYFQTDNSPLLFVFIFSGFFVFSGSACLIFFFLLPFRHVYKTASKITSSLEMNEIMKSIHSFSSAMFDFEHLGIGIIDNNKLILNLFRFNENTPFDRKTIDSEESGNLFIYTLINKKILFMKNLEKEIHKYLPDSNSLSQLGVTSGSVMIIPVLFNDENIGIVFFSSPKKINYSFFKRFVLKSFSGYMAIAVRNALMHSKIQQLLEEIDIDKKKIIKAKKDVEYLAYHDPLTDLPNRLYLDEYLKQAIKKSARSGKLLAVIFIDMDNFKYINDTYGHQTGDKVLVIAAERFRNLLRESDTVIRFGGDEFIIILEDIGSIDNLKAISDKIITTCSSPVFLDNKSFPLSFSLGISIYPNDGDTPEELIRKADIALYSVKNTTKGYWQFYSGRTE